MQQGTTKANYYNQTYRPRNYRRVKRKHRNGKLLKVILLLCALGVLIWLGVRQGPKLLSPIKNEIKNIETAAEKADEYNKVIDELAEDISSLPLNKNQVISALNSVYPWDMKITCTLEDGTVDTYVVESMIASDIEQLADEIFSGNREPYYELSFDITEEDVDAIIAELKERWNIPALKSEIEGFDKENDEIIYGKGHNGFEIDDQKLRQEILEAIEAGDYSQEFTAEGRVIETATSGEAYSVIGTYTTYSTDNENRNNNLDLACKAINGIILRPGDEFSFNRCTGNRTEEKGYKPAGAYTNNGQTVLEPGGGVCQVASTLYNALIGTGIRPTERHGHTYEPTYVTPGEDATVSYDGYDGPDLKFTNTSKSSILIRANYNDRTVICSIIGLPILEEGVTVRMESEKTETKPVDVIYINDSTLPEGTQVTQSIGSAGSVWVTYLVTEKDGVEVSRENFHTTTYKGHSKTVKVGTKKVVEVEGPETSDAVDEEEYQKSETEEIGPAFGTQNRQQNSQEQEAESVPEGDED